MLFARYLIVLTFILPLQQLVAQDISKKLQKAFSEFEKDVQLKHAMSSLYVIDAKTGKVVFDRNSKIGLAPASTQKIVTSVTAFELLGKNYKYKTYFARGPMSGLYVVGSGDPTFGSWRYPNTKDTFIFNSLINVTKAKGIRYSRLYYCDRVARNEIPGGWIVEDIANYYGAAPFNLNWRENQTDVTFIPGNKVGEKAEIDTNATFMWERFINNCTTGPVGSGDNAYVYFIPPTQQREIRGTVPAGSRRFTISTVNTFPQCSFILEFEKYAKRGGELQCSWKQTDDSLDAVFIRDPDYIHYSPSLDSIVYWFNKKSINLYGEALLRTMAKQNSGYSSTDTGTAIVKKFWKEKGIDEDELNIYDGSGLSPLNRVTTHAQVEILKYAKTKDWFQYFYNSLPEYNGMTMKSGTISDVKGFCGYHKSKDGREYIFSFLVNNYSGKSSALVNKMYKVLNELK